MVAECSLALVWEPLPVLERVNFLANNERLHEALPQFEDKFGVM